MKSSILFLIAIIPCTSCVICACWMAMHGIEGWGWFLFAALLLGSVSVTSKTGGDDSNDDEEDAPKPKAPKETATPRWN